MTKADAHFQEGFRKDCASEIKARGHDCDSPIEPLKLAEVKDEMMQRFDDKHAKAKKVSGKAPRQDVKEAFVSKVVDEELEEVKQEQRAADPGLEG